MFSSIGFMNLSLNSNSIGFYQVTKLCIVPVTLVINAYAYSVHTSNKIKVALAILLVGVGIATVTEVHLRPLGFTYGVVAIFTTAVCQIWQGSKQKEFDVSATQLQAATAPWMSAQALAASVITEFFCFHSATATYETGVSVHNEAPCDSALSFFDSAFHGNSARQRTLWIVLATCFLALAVNLCSFGLIGRTSPTTFQVVGHAKTCLVLIGGYVFFPAHGRRHQQQLYHNMMGVSVAMVGVIVYGHIKHASGQQVPDCFDHTCPGCVLAILDPESVSNAAEKDETTTPLQGASKA